MDPGKRLGLVVFGDDAFLDLPVQVFGDGFQGPIQDLVGHIAEHHIKAFEGEHMGNAVSHGSGADHAYLANAHGETSSVAVIGLSITACQAPFNRKCTVSERHR